MTTHDNSEGALEESHGIAEASLPSVGELLNAERLKQNKTEKEVADELHITMHYVRALESNSFEKLPGEVFARGYLKSYAILLGLNVEEVVSSFNAHVAKQLDVAKEQTRIQVRKRQDRNRPWVIASAALFVALFIGLWAFNFSGSEPELADGVTAPQAVEAPISQSANQFVVSDALETVAETQVPADVSENELAIDSFNPVDEPEPAAATGLMDLSSDTFNEANQVVDEVAENVSDAAVAVVAPIEAPRESSLVADADGPDDQLIHVESEGNDVLLINFTGVSWVEVSDNSNGQIYRDLLESGDSLEVIGTAPFSVLLGDAPFAELSLNGNVIDVSEDIRVDNSARVIVGLSQ